MQAPPSVGRHRPLRCCARCAGQKWTQARPRSAIALLPSPQCAPRAAGPPCGCLLLCYCCSRRGACLRPAWRSWRDQQMRCTSAAAPRGQGAPLAAGRREQRAPPSAACSRRRRPSASRCPTSRLACPRRPRRSLSEFACNCGVACSLRVSLLRALRLRLNRRPADADMLLCARSPVQPLAGGGGAGAQAGAEQLQLPGARPPAAQLRGAVRGGAGRPCRHPGVAQPPHKARACSSGF